MTISHIFLYNLYILVCVVSKAKMYRLYRNMIIYLYNLYILVRYPV